jgi:hypothetical protein
MTAERRAYMDKYNTRRVTAEIPSIDTVLTDNFLGRPQGKLEPDTTRRK